MIKRKTGTRLETSISNRRLSVGADAQEDGVHFRVWAPHWRTCQVVLEDSARAKGASSGRCLSREAGGYFSGLIKEARTGSRYRFRENARKSPYPDPVSRFQPEGPHGPSQVVDPGKFTWTDSKWTGVLRSGQVIYEMHVGTFTAQGTWKAAAEQLAELARLGVTMLELMPVAEFPGRFGWGYDGVNLFAPSHLYGSPDDFRLFVDRAHGAGLGVILDVVYNHLGPDGNFLSQFSPDYFTDRYKNDWGQAINFDGRNNRPSREFFIANATYWIKEFHLDGLRLDATQQIFDSSPVSILTEITLAVRAAAGDRGTFIVAENEPQHAILMRPIENGGNGLDAMWNDDFHHSAMVRLTGRNEAYYTDYKGSPQEFLSAAKHGFLYQGQHYKWQKQRRGAPSLDLEPAQFVTFIQNHDQIANSFRGDRVNQLSSPGRYRAMTGLLLLGPSTPMLFQGQEFAASAPFLYFADHNPELAKLVAQGRREFLGQFPSLAVKETSEQIPDPSAVQTFERCKLNFAERRAHQAIYRMHRDLLQLRRDEIVPRALRKGDFDGAVLGPGAFVLRYFHPTGDDRLLLVNFDVDLDLEPAPEPLLAPPENHRWALHWSSEDPKYGGSGTAEVERREHWRLPGRATVLLVPKPLRRKP